MTALKNLRQDILHSRSLALFVAVTLGGIASPSIGFCQWSNGDRNESKASMGWASVWPPTKSSQLTPAMAAANEVHVVDVFGGNLLRDFAWSKTDGWKAPALLSLPGSPVLGAGPALSYRGGGIFDLIVRGSDQYYHAFLASGAGWSDWEPIGGWGGDPAVTTTIINGDVVVDVWVQREGSIRRRRWQWPSWKEWEDIGRPSGKTLVTAPGVVVRPGGTIDIVAGAAGDGQLYHAYFSPTGQFSGWEMISGSTFAKPALTSPSATRLDLWIRRPSDQLVYHSVWDATATPAGWSRFDSSINIVRGALFAIRSTPAVPGNIGVAAVLSGGVTTVALVDGNDKLVVRSWADPVAMDTTAKPTTTITNTIITASAENAVAVIPPSAGAPQAECKSGGVIYSRGANWDLERVGYACAVGGVGLQPLGSTGVCPATKISTIPNTGSKDSQIIRLNDGRLVWLYQNGGVSTPTVPGVNNQPVTRGTETVRVSTDCGKTWSLIATLDPCVGAPFDTSMTCNTASVPGTTAPTGTDRPELFASPLDGSIYIALGVAGTAAYNLHIVKSQGASLSTWKDLDTGLGSGGAVAMAETSARVYFARAEYGGNPYNVGLYSIAKGAGSDEAFHLVGNLADLDASGNVQLSLLNDVLGDVVFRWAYLTSTGGIRRGFSKLSPGGIITFASDLYQPSPAAGTVALPTLVASPTTSKRAFLYWYEGTSAPTGTYSVKGAISDGVGRWSPPVTLGGPWPGSTTFSQMGQAGNDYLKGVYLGGEDTFLATWLQPDSGVTPPNRLGQAAVK